MNESADQPQPPPGADPTAKKRKKWPWWAAGTVAVLIVIIVATNTDDDSNLQQRAVPDGAATSPVTQGPATTTAVTQAPLTTTAPAPTFLPAEVHQGTGDDVVSTTWPTQSGIVTFECRECSGNTAVETDGDESLLVNTIGSYVGTRWINIRGNSRTSTFTITARGQWTLTIADRDALAPSGNRAAGSGDAVVSLSSLTTKATITNQGEGNFAIEVLSSRGGGYDLAVNEIGGYQGTVPLQGPALVQVTSDGQWTIEGSS